MNRTLSLFPCQHYFKNMIGETGKNLSVLIVTEPDKNWETFETWYSIFKNLPDARVAIGCQRTPSIPFQLFQWARRLKLNLFFHNPFTHNDPVANRLDAIHRAIGRKMVDINILVIPPLIMSIDVLDHQTITEMQEKNIWMDECVWFLQKPNIKEMINQHFLEEKEIHYDPIPLCVEANETAEVSWLVSHQKGCGKWIDTLRGCPFSSAAGLATMAMTVNEHRIIELWKRMCPIYNALM